MLCSDLATCLAGYPDNSDSDPEGLNIVGQAHAIASYASLKHGRTIPTALTETNWGFHNLTDWLNHSTHMQVRTLKIARQVSVRTCMRCCTRHSHPSSLIELTHR